MSNHKFIIFLGDGMADLPLAQLGNRTVLEAATTPFMDFMAREGITGLTQTVPPGMSPGSDTANLAVFGYNPRDYYTGRAPLEAINMGISMGPRDAAFRCNTVRIDDGRMVDFTGNHIDSALSKKIIEEVGRSVAGPGFEFYPGVSYRHIMIWREYPHTTIPETTPPHDITGKKCSDYLPQGAGSEMLREIMVKAAPGLSTITADSELRGNANEIWLWGGGLRPAMEPLTARFGLRGFTISAVDLIHGIGRAAGLSPIMVPGVTGYLDTNYKGKADAAIAAMERGNFVFLHVESPDESGHEGNIEHKIRAVEDFDHLVVGPVLDALREKYHFTALVMPDHPTPISVRTHTSDPVPFAIYDSDGYWNTMATGRGASGFSEREASATGLVVREGHSLLESIVTRKMPLS